MQLSRSGIVMTLLALIALRVVTGLHFFNEGISKVRSGDFDASGFLQQARGPWAGLFHGLTDDRNGHRHLGISPEPPWQPAPQRTIAIWETWSQSLADQQQADRAARDRIDRELATAGDRLRAFYENNRLEISAWLDAENRLDGFARDGNYRGPTASGVASLQQQVDRIAADRKTVAGGWFATIDAIWDDLETGVRQAVSEPRALPLPRPWAPANSTVAWINRVLPWFDLVIGVLLVIGLWTRLAAVAGMLLLLGVVATQPFWVSAAANTWFQWMELAVLFLLLATAAGRVGGLDYFLDRRRKPPALMDSVPA